jgi:hypothetical protein
MTRKRLTERKVLEVLIVNQKAVIPCGICRLAFKAEDVSEIERDHARCRETFTDEDLHLWDTIEQQRYVHGECHKRKTNGTKATSAGSDQHMAAKGRRLRGETKQGPKAKIRSRPFPTAEQRQALREKYAR